MVAEHQQEQEKAAANKECLNIQLLDACRDGDEEHVHQLIKMGANTNYEDNSGFTPLLSATYYGYDSIVITLIEDGQANPNYSTDFCQYTPLHQACYYGHLTIAKYLIERANANPNCRDNDGETPLYRATLQDQTNIIHYLVTGTTTTTTTRHVNVNVNCQNNDGDTPLHEASRKGLLELVQWLVRYGVNIFCTNNDDKKPSDIAWLYQDVKTYLRDAETLLKAISSSDSDSVKDEEIVAMLEDANTNYDLSIRDEDGNSLLLLACLHGREQVLDYLMRTTRTNTPHRPVTTTTTTTASTDQADRIDDNAAATTTTTTTIDIVHDRNHKGMTAVHCASMGGHLAMIQRLVENEGLDLHTKDCNGWTLLHWACNSRRKSNNGKHHNTNTHPDPGTSSSNSAGANDNNNIDHDNSCHHDSGENDDDDHDNVRVIAWLLSQGLDPLDSTAQRGGCSSSTDGDDDNNNNNNTIDNNNNNSNNNTPLHLAIDSRERDAIKLLIVKLVLHWKSSASSSV